ncbi:hypothetical protein [Caballeronia sp. Lep1P3]|uniref:hypothetical protein n=1 Tax=Caballeronia sp. Lep1P3 TaxID=2878150 RepID=UPI001FD5D463|nr:hypothetical protein [Caballeronia sp. Lep1P3]
MTADHNSGSATPRERDAQARLAIAANAAKMLDTTRRAWSDAPAEAPSKEAGRRAPHASRKKRIVPRRSRWPSLIAALNYWSPKPL